MMNALLLSIAQSFGGHWPELKPANDDIYGWPPLRLRVGFIGSKSDQILVFHPFSSFLSLKQSFAGTFALCIQLSFYARLSSIVHTDRTHSLYPLPNPFHHDIP